MAHSLPFPPKKYIDTRLLAFRYHLLVRVIPRTTIVVQYFQLIQLPEAINLITELAVGFITSSGVSPHRFSGIIGTGIPS